MGLVVKLVLFMRGHLFVRDVQTVQVACLHIWPFSAQRAGLSDDGLGCIVEVGGGDG